MKFKKKPVVIDAVQIAKRMDVLEPTWWYEAVRDNRVILHGIGRFSEGLPMVSIDTLEGTTTAFEGDWIIRGVKGELYPCRPDIFARIYTPVCDGNHGGDPCGDPECWQHPVPDKKAWAEMQDELVRDATRYRFLRDSRRSENLDSLARTTYTMESLDEAIDAALKEERDAK